MGNERTAWCGCDDEAAHANDLPAGIDMTRRIGADFHERWEPSPYESPFQRWAKMLASPPPGWFTFGHHVDVPGIDLEFWGEDDGGLPIWERPKPRPRRSAGPHDERCERRAWHDANETPCEWRERSCVAEWPECVSGEYNPACCRFPKSCSVEDVEVPRD